MSSESALKTIDHIYAAAIDPANHQAFEKQWESYLSRQSQDAEEEVLIGNHLDRALEIIERMHFSGQKALSPSTLVETINAPAAVIDLEGSVSTCNSIWAEQMPKCQNSIWPLSQRPQIQRRIREVLQAVSHVTDMHTEIVAIDPTEARSFTTFAFRRLPFDRDDERDLILVRGSGLVWPEPVTQILRREFGLTEAECTLFREIFEGATFSEIAKQRQRSIETLKAQSKTIYRKLGISGREGVVRFGMQLQALLDRAVPRDAPGASPRIEREFLVLQTGQRIAIHRYGAADGRPIVFLHGMSLGYGLPPAFIDRLTDKGFQIILIERPGYGDSDSPKDWPNAVNEWATLFPDILAKLNIKRCPVVTHTTGVMHACAAAAKSPHTTAAIFAISGGVPITDPKMTDTYPRQLRLIVRSAKHSPRAIRFFMASSSTFFYRSGGREATIQGIYNGCPSDRAALSRDGTIPLIAKGMECAFDGGFRGFIGDAMHIFDDWSEWPASMKCRMTYLIGDEDPICPVEWARLFAQKHVHISVDDIPGAGQLAFYSHPIEIADRLTAFLRSAPT